MTIDYKYLTASLFFITLITGCASTSISTGENIQLKDDEGIIFGLVEHNFYDFDNNKLPAEENTKFSYSFAFGDSERGWFARNYGPVSMFKEGAVRGDTSKQNKLFVHSLSKGAYTIGNMYITQGQMHGEVPLPEIPFNVTPNNATYIGNIIMEFMAIKGLFGETRYKLSKITTMDKLEEAKIIYKKEHPKLNYKIISDVINISVNISVNIR